MRFRLLVALFCLFPAAFGLAQTAAPPAGAAGSEAPSGDGGLTPEQLRKGTQDQIDAMAARLAKDGGRDDEWMLLARSYLRFEEFDKAKDAARHLIALHPKAIEPRLILGEAQMSERSPGQGLPADFVGTMREILALDANNPAGLFYVGAAEADAGHAGETRKLWTRLLAILDKDDPRRADLASRLKALPKK